jgi:hypothetical protein
MNYRGIAAAAVALFVFGATAAGASEETCASSTGDVALSARTPEVDLFNDAAGAAKAMTLEADKFPACTPITGRSPNMMLQVQMNGTKYWVPPHMVKYRFAGKLPAICRNLALGSNQEKAGATRGLGEGCPKAGGH